MNNTQVIFPLTDQEVQAVKSMAFYWNEVRQREDKSPLNDELRMMQARFGGRMLDLLEFAASAPETATERDELKALNGELVDALKIAHAMYLTYTPEENHEGYKEMSRVIQAALSKTSQGA